MDKELIINGKKVKVTNLEKIYWPKDGITKGELIEYYRSVAKFILPYLKNRPESLHRFPEGIDGLRFYQKNVESHPEWVETERVWSGSTGEYVNYVVCNDEETLVYLVNLGCIEMNVWSSSIPKLEKPDYLVIDLDPEGVEFEAVIQTALVVKEVFDLLNITCFPKTSGASGIHIFVPTGAKYTYDQVRQFARIVVAFVHQKLPEITSLERHPEKRQGKVYLDWVQNTEGATMASVYSVRPKEGATVSMPLDWEEVKSGLKPTDFTIKNALQRIEKKGDLFAPVLHRGVDLEAALKKLNELS